MNHDGCEEDVIQRQELERRLMAVYAAPGESWDNVTEEVFRQMEWARRQIPTWLSPVGLAKINLTVAPDDWKP